MTQLFDLEVFVTGHLSDFAQLASTPVWVFLIGRLVIDLVVSVIALVRCAWEQLPEVLQAIAQHRRY